MQENSLSIKENKIEHIITLCANGRYGEAVELLMNSGFYDAESPSYLARNPITEALHEWDSEKECIGNWSDCCGECAPCLGVCCCLPLCAFCCITPFISHDTFSSIAGSSVGCCENTCEKVLCSCWDCL